MDLSSLETALGVSFKNKELLKQALIHKSYIAEHPEANSEANERIEFLGDAVLELVTSEYLFKKFPHESEGWLTNWRSVLVNTQMLSTIAKKLDVPRYILLSKGEALSAGAKKESILANTLEALIGALYLDQGYKAARDFVKRHILVNLPELLKKGAEYNPKGFFQEQAQGRLGITPSYEVLKEWGPDHAKHFLVGVYLGDELVAQGEGGSKQEAQEEAARKAIKAKGWNKE